MLAVPYNLHNNSISLQVGPFKEHMKASELCSMWIPYLHRPRCFLIEVTQIKPLASMKTEPAVIKKNVYTFE